MVKNVFKKLGKKQKNNKGFSLVELIVVIAIMAVLVGVLAPQLIKYVEKSRQSTDMQSVQQLKSSVETDISDNENVRKKVRCCDRDCWMIGSVSPAMHKYIWKPSWWVFTHKVKSVFGGKYSMYENKICREYRDGKVTKDELDNCSTCDKNCVVNNGLSEASKAQLVGKTGEEIVDADIANQMKEM